MTAIFISHSSADNDAAAEIKRWLEAQGHSSLFLDFDPDAGIRAGANWEQTLYRHLRQCQAVIALVSPAWLASRWCFAELVQARERGKPVYVVKIAPVDTSALFGDLQHIDLTERREDGLERLRLGLLERGIDPLDAFDWDPARPPYPGLLAFEAQDAAIFFGRGEALARTLEALDALRRQSADAARFTLLLGASGSGKSSLARAGVLPRLAKRPAEWLVLAPMRPQQEPLQELAATLATAFAEAGQPRDWDALRRQLQDAAADPASGGARLLGLTRELAVAARRLDATVLLTVDQAEELFSYTASDAAEAFLRLLRAALEQGDRRLMVLATLRSDFLGSFQNHPALQDKDYGHHLRYRALTVDPMPLRSVPEVVRGPARLCGLELEEGLVDAIVGDIGDQDALPLLAFTLRRMYERAAGRGRMTLQDYEAVGRLEGSVRREAERLLEESRPGPEDVDALHAAFVPTLVRINPDGSFARRRALVEHLPRRVLALLRRFVDARLLVSDRDTQGRETHEVAHEALLRTWPQLSEWLASDRDTLRLLEGLSRAAQDWEQSARQADLLVHRDGRLQELDTLLVNPRFALPPGSLELAYLEACRVAQRAREAAAREEQERRVRDAERIAEEQTRAAAAQRRAATLFRRFGVVASLLFLLAAGAAWFAWQQFGAATQANRRVAQVQQTARHASDLSAGPQRSLLLAVQAAALQPGDPAGRLGAIDGLRQPLRVAGGWPLPGPAAPPQAAAYSSDGRWLATGDGEGRIRVWDLSAIDPAAGVLELAGPGDAVVGLAFVAGSPRLVGAGRSGRLQVWTLDGGRATAAKGWRSSGRGALRALALAPDGRRLALGHQGGELCLWQVTADGLDGETCDPRWKDGVPITTLAFSPGGRWLGTACIGACANGGFDAPVRLFEHSDDGGLGPPRRLGRRSELVEPSLQAFAFGADDTTLAVAYGYVVERWDLRLPEPAAEPLGSYASGGGWVQALAVSADGRWLALASGASADVRLWDLRSGATAPVRLSGHGAPVTVLKFGGGGRWLASGATDGGLNLRDLASPDLHLQALRGHELAVRQLVIPPGAEVGSLLSWGDDARARLWRLPDPLADPVVLRGPAPAGIVGMAASPDGRWLAASAENDLRLALWASDDPRAPARLLDLPADARAIAFSPDGRWLAAKSPTQGRIGLWDLRAPDQPPRVLAENQWSDDRTLTFSPDSRWLASGTWGDAEGRNPRLHLWDLSGDAPASTPRFACKAPSPVRELAFSADGARLGSAAHDTSAYLWNLRADDPCAAPVALPHGDVVYQIAFSPDGRWAATASMDRKGRVWSLPPGGAPTLARELAFGDRVFRTAISPDGRWAAFGSWDASAALLDLRDPAHAELRLLRGHVARILATAFSPDGEWLATAGEDRVIRLWRPDAPGAAPLVLHGHDATVAHLGFSPDARWLVSGSYDGTLRRWRLRREELAELACRTAGRGLSIAELAQYLGPGASDRCAAPAR